MARRPQLLLTLLTISLVGLFSSPFQQLCYLLRLPFIWNASSAAAVISDEHDRFDVTFAAYEANSSTADAGHPSLIPPIVHHIHLGSRPPRPEWLEARETCLKHHTSWSSFIWNEESAEKLVREEFPHLYLMWKSYPYMIQRVDALRYMVLQKHGGVVLDYDLACRRSLEPLRRFEFVAPAAHPAGLSIGMMLSSPGNPYIKALVDNLPPYNYRWFYIPYVTVMFSTGCHYASTIYTLQSNRSPLRILSGPPDAPRMHMLNGQVDTPLFHHLGSSSWHNRDAWLISLFKNINQRALFAILILSLLAVTIMILLCCVCRARGRSSDEEGSTSVPKSLTKSA